MSKIRFRYEGLDVCDGTRKWDRTGYGYPEFRVVSRRTGKTLVHFYTNGYLEGKFIRERRNGNFRQTLGTGQFSVPYKKSSARAFLRDMAYVEEADDILFEHPRGLDGFIYTKDYDLWYSAWNFTPSQAKRYIEYFDEFEALSNEEKEMWAKKDY